MRLTEIIKYLKKGATVTENLPEYDGDLPTFYTLRYRPDPHSDTEEDLDEDVHVNQFIDLTERGIIRHSHSMSIHQNTYVYQKP